MTSTIRECVGDCRNLHGRYYGVEIEVENASIPDEVEDTGWRVINDGSLRRDGLEFVSAGPYTLDHIEEDILAFYGWYERYDYWSNIRTSTHVHVNVLDFTPQEVAAAATVHALVEPLLFRYCGPQREENIYCVPWYRAPDDYSVVASLVNGRVSHVNRACKYSSLYLEPVRRFGTLEFRHAPVFPTAGMLLEWIDMCSAIVYSGFGNPTEVIQTFNAGTVNDFVRTIFGEELYKVLRGACEADFEELLEKYDVLTTVELHLGCTYNPNVWFVPKMHVEDPDEYTESRLATSKINCMTMDVLGAMRQAREEMEYDALAMEEDHDYAEYDPRER